MKSTALLLLAVALVAALALTNPSEDRFAAVYADRANAELVRELGLSGVVGELLGGFAHGAIETALAERVERRDLGVASLFTLPRPGEDVRALGVLGRIVPLSGGGALGSR